MRRSRLAPFALLLLALVSLPVAARTSSLLSANEAAAECPDVAAGVSGEPADTTAKPVAAKRSAAPASTKARPAARGADTAPVRAPRWHRFIPGMYR